MQFTVKAKDFEGPLDLLLDLIERRKFFVNDVSLAKVTDDFIRHIQRYENMPMSESAHFILIASTLLLIKSRSLLPQLSLTEEEQADIHDLEKRLKIYKRIKEASAQIEKIFGDQMIFPQKARRIEPVFAPSPDFTLERVLSSLQDLIKRLPKKEKLPEVMVKKVISLEDMIGDLTRRVQAQLRMSFKDFAGEHKGDKVNFIVSFLAMLELVKQGIVDVTQESNFGDIQMETKSVGVPRY